MTFLALIPVILSYLLMAAHFLRGGHPLVAYLLVGAPLLLLIKKKWVMRVVQLGLLYGVYVWADTAILLVRIRAAHGMPATRLGIILGSVALFTLLGAAILQLKRIRRRYESDTQNVTPPLAAFLTTFALLAIVHVKPNLILLMAERFSPGAGWVEIVLLSLYAGWITGLFMNPALKAQKKSKLRAIIWTGFSMVFFLQLLMGLAGLEGLLMTGKLHLPVPAMIMAGPIYRGAGFFMPILFLIAMVLTGPAWCSFLCYIGSWDNLTARRQKKPGTLPKSKTWIRWALLGLVAVSALILRLLGVNGTVATGLGALFGLMGVGIMLFVSRKNGVMTHCVTYCPMGLAANLLGKISPFRVRISNSCTDCGACTSACRYDALAETDIAKRKPGFTCTLCGDCTHTCPHASIDYRFFTLSPKAARALFYVMVVSFHAVCLGVARI